MEEVAHFLWTGSREHNALGRPAFEKGVTTYMALNPRAWLSLERLPLEEQEAAS